MTTTQGNAKPLTVGGHSLVSTGPGRVLYTGGDVTVDDMRPFLGLSIEVHSVDYAHPVKAVRLAQVTRDRETGDVLFWAVDGAGHGTHVRAVAGRKGG